MSLWTMKQVMKMLGVTENALRYYNAKGILPPTMQEDTGRRQWLYDEEAVWKLKKLILLKFIGAPAGQIGASLGDDEEYRKAIMKSLEDLKKERDRLDRKIFVAETLALSFGKDLVGPGDGLNEGEAEALNEVIREIVRKNER